tara:strand:+ start:20251 stop:21018 length:768 start_codon:yes stop_codon:yes gene_type:complete
MKEKPGLVAVIGGTGMNQWPGLETISQQQFDTPYGPASAPVITGALNACPALFLARHGEGHKIPPHKINYRANIHALKQAGATQIISIAAVGGIAEWFAPGTVAVPIDLIDYTWGREHTYADGSALAGDEVHHVEFTHPYDPDLRKRLYVAAEAAQVMIVGSGIIGITQGPRLETPAEIERMRRDGCDMVGMTGMPEAALAAEAGLPYACLAVSVNWAAGIGSGGIHDEIEESIEQGMSSVRAVLEAQLSSTSAQ